MVLGACVSFHRHLVGVDVGGWASSSSFLPPFVPSLSEGDVDGFERGEGCGFVPWVCMGET